MVYIAHIHEDDLELYSAGHLEAEFLPALESHLLDCQYCLERLHQCLGPRLEALRQGYG